MLAGEWDFRRTLGPLFVVRNWFRGTAWECHITDDYGNLVKVDASDAVMSLLEE